MLDQVSSTEIGRRAKNRSTLRWTARLLRFCWTLAVSAALVVPAQMATAQSSESASSNKDSDRKRLENRCKLVKAKRGESAEVVPTEAFTPEQGKIFPYLGRQQSLLEPFRIEDDRDRDCAFAFGLPWASGGSALGAPTAVAAAPAAVAPGALAPAGIAAGGIAAGAVAVGLGVVVLGGVIGVAAGVGKGGGSNSSSGTQ